MAFAIRKGRFQVTHSKSFTCVDFSLTPAGWHDPSYRCLLPPSRFPLPFNKGTGLCRSELNHLPRVRTISHPRMTIVSCSKKRLCLSNDTSISSREEPSHLGKASSPLHKERICCKHLLPESHLSAKQRPSDYRNGALVPHYEPLFSKIGASDSKRGSLTPK